MSEQAPGQQQKGSRPTAAKQRKASAARLRSSRSHPVVSKTALPSADVQELEPLREAPDEEPSASSPSASPRPKQAAKPGNPSVDRGRSTPAGGPGARRSVAKVKKSEAAVGYRGVRGKRHPSREAARAANNAASGAAETGAASSSAAEISASGAAEAKLLSETSAETAPKKVSPQHLSLRPEASPRRLSPRQLSPGSPRPEATPNRLSPRRLSPRPVSPQSIANADKPAVDSHLAPDTPASHKAPRRRTDVPKNRSSARPQISARMRAVTADADTDLALLVEDSHLEGVLEDQEAEVSYGEDEPRKTPLEASTMHRLKVKVDSDPGARTNTEKRCSVSSTASTDFVFSFRFFNYNMANKPEIQMDNIGTGFAARRHAKEDFGEGDDEADIANMAASFGVPDAAELRRTMSASSSLGGLWCGRRVPFEELLAAGVPGKNEASFRSQTAMTRQDSMATEMTMKHTGTSGMLAIMRTASTIFSTKSRRSSSAPAKAPRKQKKAKEPKGAPDKKQKSLMDFLQPEGRSSAACSVDCCFSVLSETRYSCSHLDGVAEDIGERALVKRTHAHNMSAVQTLAERGGLDGMKGKVAGSMVGDLRTVVLYSTSMELVEDAKVFCPFDEANVMETSKLKSNPMKCFMGQTFDAACGALRFVLLGTHFPMQKITKLMSNGSQDLEELLPQLKGIVARTLRKILRNVLLGGVLDGRTMLILQGDLNSRTVHSNGRWFDLLHETLQDPMLQNSMSAELPQELQGEWREVVTPRDSGYLPVTYRFDVSSQQTVLDGGHLRLNQVYGNMGPDVDTVDNDASTEASTRLPSNWPSAESSVGGNTHGGHTSPVLTPGTPNSQSSFSLSPFLDSLKPYRDIVDKLGSKAGDVGLFQQKGDGKEEKGKFKPGRLPSCTERVLYYAPDGLQQRTTWHSQRGYEVNYQQLGSDHKPVLMEATLRVGRTFGGSPRRKNSKVFNRQFSLNSADSDNSSMPPLSRESSLEEIASEDSAEDRKQKARSRARTSSPEGRATGALRRVRTAVRIVTGGHAELL